MDLLEINNLEEQVFSCSSCQNICNEFYQQKQYRLPEFGMKIREDKQILVIGQNPGFNKKLNDSVVNKNNFFNYYESRIHSYPVPSFIEKLGLKLSSVYYTNLIKCPTYMNRMPSMDESLNCFRFLKKQIDLIIPKYIIAFGRLARLTLSANETLFPFVKRFIYFYHPSYIFKLDQIKSEKLLIEFRNIIKTITCQ